VDGQLTGGLYVPVVVDPEGAKGTKPPLSTKQAPANKLSLSLPAVSSSTSTATTLPLLPIPASTPTPKYVARGPFTVIFPLI
jgi:hypothetical protein